MQSADHAVGLAVARTIGRSAPLSARKCRCCCWEAAFRAHAPRFDTRSFLCTPFCAAHLFATTSYATSRPLKPAHSPLKPSQLPSCPAHVFQGLKTANPTLHTPTPMPPLALLPAPAVKSLPCTSLAPATRLARAAFTAASPLQARLRPQQHLFFCNRRPPPSSTRPLHSSPLRMEAQAAAAAAAAPADPIVQYVVIRKDLWTDMKWPLGSVVAQACHASTAAMFLHFDDEITAKYVAAENVNSMHKVGSRSQRRCRAARRLPGGQVRGRRACMPLGGAAPTAGAAGLLVATMP